MPNDGCLSEENSSGTTCRHLLRGLKNTNACSNVNCNTKIHRIVYILILLLCHTNQCGHHLKYTLKNYLLRRHITAKIKENLVGTGRGGGQYRARGAYWPPVCSW